MKISKFQRIAAGATLASLALAGSALAKDYVLNTASTGGTYHPVGTAISTLTKIKLLPKQKFSLTAVNSAGSGANIHSGSQHRPICNRAGSFVPTQQQVLGPSQSRKKMCVPLPCSGRMLSSSFWRISM